MKIEMKVRDNDSEWNEVYDTEVDFPGNVTAYLPENCMHEEPSAKQYAQALVDWFNDVGGDRTAKNPRELVGVRELDTAHYLELKARNL